MNLPRLSVTNPVAANLVMWALILAGAVSWTQLIREMFPNSDPEQVSIAVAWPGASPGELEKTVALRVERRLESLQDIDEIRSTMVEGLARIQVTLDDNASRDRVLNDIRSEIDIVQTELPEDAEDPEVAEARPFFPVIAVVLAGDVSESRLEQLARDVRDDLLDAEEITEVRVTGVREREVLVEVRRDALEEHRLTFAEVADAVLAHNTDLPGGRLRGPRGDIRVRTLGEREVTRSLETIVLRDGPDEGRLLLGQVAAVREGFADTIEAGRYGGRPAAILHVFKTPEQDAILIADFVKDYVAARPERLNGAVDVGTMTDLSKFIRGRLDLMLNNARTGLILVLLALVLFLDLRVAFWVAVGLPTAFLGTFFVMELMGLSINLITLFGMIIVLGIVVDDAIIVGENVFTRIRQGRPAHQAAIEATQEVARPVFAAVVTTIIAFSPLAFIDGRMGSFLGVLPYVVIAALVVSLIEVLYILPAHLMHLPQRTPPRGLWHRFSEWRTSWLEERLPAKFTGLLKNLLSWRYVTVAGALGLLLTASGLSAGGIVPFEFFQKMDSEFIDIQVEMADGANADSTLKTLKAIETRLLEAPEVEHAFVTHGLRFSEEGAQQDAEPERVGQISVELKEAAIREAAGERDSTTLSNLWRRYGSTLPGISSFGVDAKSGGPSGPDIEILVRARDPSVLGAAVAHVRERLGSYAGVVEMDDDLDLGKQEAQLTLRDSVTSTGLTTAGAARQVRFALQGAEAQKLQREDDEVTLRVQLPPEQRRTLSDLMDLRLATPRGGRVPLEEAFQIDLGRAPATLKRLDGDRIVTVRAEIDSELANVSDVNASLAVELADLGARFPGTSVLFEGRQKQQQESMGSLAIGFPVALLAIFVVIAILFQSYVQPLIVMSVIPFALIGAIAGHWVMGYPLTLLSVIGLVALSGIVVNDSLILVEFINRRVQDGVPLLTAAVEGSRARFRAIILTSTTTVLGLAPLMLETSFQARFLIPMAISIVFGLIFATVITLVLVPCLYLILEDLRGIWRWIWTGTRRPTAQPAV